MNRRREKENVNKNMYKSLQENACEGVLNSVHISYKHIITRHTTNHNTE